MKPRLLLALPQLPQDPSSGAARSIRTAAEFACQAGFEVRGIGTTATELAQKTGAIPYLNSMGVEPRVCRVPGSAFRAVEYSQKGIHYTLLDTGNLGPERWERTHGRQFDKMFDRELETDIRRVAGRLAAPSACAAGALPHRVLRLQPWLFQ
jgi:hypothetical protein